MTLISYNHKANTSLFLGRKKQYTASIINPIMAPDLENSIPDCFLKTACNPQRSTAWVLATY